MGGGDHNEDVLPLWKRQPRYLDNSSSGWTRSLEVSGWEIFTDTESVCPWWLWVRGGSSEDIVPLPRRPFAQVSVLHKVSILHPYMVAPGESYLSAAAFLYAKGGGWLLRPPGNGQLAQLAQLPGPGHSDGRDAVPEKSADRKSSSSHTSCVSGRFTFNPPQTLLHIVSEPSFLQL